MRTLKNEETEKSLREIVDETNQLLEAMFPRAEELNKIGCRLRTNDEFCSEVKERCSDILKKYSKAEIIDILNICGIAICNLSYTLCKSKASIPFNLETQFYYVISNSCFNPDILSKDIQSVMDKISTEKIEIYISIADSSVHCKLI